MAALSRLCLASALTFPFLTACGSSGDEFAPVCPRPVILSDGSDLLRFRGTGRDFLDTTLQGRITGIAGSCKRDGADVVVASVSVGMELTRGPAAAGRSDEVAYFIAVSEGDRVLDKQVYRLSAGFPENTDRVALTGNNVDLRLPVSATKKADAYQVTVGFQLTPEELATNRRGIGQHR